MAKKILKIILKIIIFVLIYLFQMYVVNSTMFFGINGDICLAAIAVTALLEKKHVAYIIAVLCGVISDLLFSFAIGKYLLIYLLVVTVLIGLKKMYKQDSKFAIIVFTVISVVISEVVFFFFYITSTGEIVNIFTLIFNIFKQCIIDICLAFAVYLALKLCSEEE